jgi:hypothetical protein
MLTSKDRRIKINIQGAKQGKREKQMGKQKGKENKK